ncbi:hypothetical protein TRFO_34873 [Tritrichomonas foetus]|uniref:Raptor N-terminal CASPase-like domain-containing protein n=1 Tax=Tritrichomonas foetus TaxID=1144522 RepID=A0A1J4JHM9_9EUKA|nr:hypothetical protein TRFO_34873 [Tritrichomonas foetus]|eukprot:OHS98658.1 hypothetical protein TRFO_34873 [Tritrichomonas foetus]
MSDNSAPRARQSSKERSSSFEVQNPKQSNSFGLWRYNLKSLISPVSTILKKTSTNTDMCVSIVTVCLLHLERNMRWAGLELSSRHYCWSDMKNRDPVSISEAVSFQLRQNLVSFVQDNVITLSDPSPPTILQSYEKIKNNQSNSRCLFIFNGHGTPEPVTDSSLILSPDEGYGTSELKVSELVGKFPIPGCFIFDCDFAGSLYKSFVEASGNKDRFGLFSCSADECLPHRLGLPSDLFTSCLLTPAIVSMLWGSRQFYAFNAGGLHQFQITYFSDENGIRPHLLSFSYEIERLLQCLTKAMAYSLLKCDFLYNMFYRDQKVGKLFSNFCLAKRIGSEIGFTPISYPEIPDFSRHPLWEYFDLYLDRVLLRLTQMDSTKSGINQSQISSDMINFLSDALVAIEHALNLQFFESIPLETSLFPLILVEKSLYSNGINVLTKFIDTGEQALRAGLCYGLLPILLSLPLQTERDLLLPVSYCVAKLLCFSLHDASLINFTCSGSKIALFLLSAANIYGQQKIDYTYYYILALIIITVGLKIDPDNEAKRVPPNILQSVLQMFNNENIMSNNTNEINSANQKKKIPNQMVIYWCLMFIGEYFGKLKSFVYEFSKLPIMQSIICAIDSPNSEVRAAFVSAFSSLIIYEKTLLKRYGTLFVQILSVFIEDPSHLVRIQVLFLIDRFFNVIKKKTNGNISENQNFHDVILSSLKSLSVDPHPEICPLAIKLFKKYVNDEINDDGETDLSNFSKSNIKNDIPNTNTFSTTLLPASFDAFLHANFNKLNDFVIPPFCEPSFPHTQFSPKISPRHINDIRCSEIDHIELEKPILTNFTFFNGEKILFVEENKIIIRNYGDHIIENTLDLTKFLSPAALINEISTLLPLTDDSLLLATKKGDIAIISKILTQGAVLADCFKFASTEEDVEGKLQENFLFDFNSKQRILYGTIEEGNVTPWSLDMCSMLDNIKIFDGQIRCMKMATPIQSNPKMNPQMNQNENENNIILAIGTDIDFRFVDITDPENVQTTLIIDSVPYVFKPILSMNGSFAIIFRDGKIRIADSKNKARSRIVGVQEGAYFLDTTEWGNIILVGGQNTVLIDLITTRTYNVLETMYLKRQQPGTIISAILHNRKQTLSFIVQPSSIYTAGILIS